MVSYWIGWSLPWITFILACWSIYQTRMHSTSIEALRSLAIAGPVEYAVAAGVFISRRIPRLIFGRKIF